MGTNTFNTIKSNGGVIAKLAAGTLVDNLQFAKSIAKADETDYNGKNGYSAGDTIYVSQPAVYLPTAAFDQTSTIQSVLEQKKALVLDIISSVAVDIDSQELASTVNIKSIYNRVVKPAVQGIAQDVEKTMLSRAVVVTSNIVGTAGATVFDPDTMMSAGQKLDEFLASQMGDDRFALLSPAAKRSAVNARKGFPNATDAIAKQYKSGAMGQADGFTYLSNNLMPRLTTGTATGAHTVTTTSVAGATTIALTGTGSQTLTAGQTFTVAGCNAVHPQTKADLGYLKQFVITALNTASSGAYTAVALADPIYTATSGSLQNITRFPTASDVVTLGAGTGNTLSTTTTQNLVFHKDAYRMVSVPLVMPDAVELAVQETYEGITVAIVRAFDVLKRRMITRIDFLGGFCAPRAEWACRITS